MIRQSHPSRLGYASSKISKQYNFESSSVVQIPPDSLIFHATRISWPNVCDGVFFCTTPYLYMV